MIELAERVEAAVEPNRELDAEIARAICWRWDGWEDGDRRIEERELVDVIRDVLFSCNSIWKYLPSYSASLDAAATLVPSGWQWTVTDFQGAAPAIAVLGNKMIIRNAATPALALCAASLRTLAIREDSV